MPYAPRRTKKSSSKRSRVSRRRTRKSTVPQSVRTYVRKAISTQVENKMANVATSKTFNTNFGTWDDISPTIFQSATVAGRSGNQIKIKTVKMRYVLCLNSSGTAPYNPFSYGQFNFRMLIGHLVVAQYSSPNAADNLQLLRAGSSSVGPDSSLTSLLRPINKEWFKIHVDRKFKVGTNNQSAAPFTNNNDYPVVCMGSMDITKCYKKTLRFEDASSRPTNSGTFLNAILTDLNGTPTVYTTAPVRLSYEIDIIYEDA